MVDFMANIKNKKSMKKYNVKTLAEIAVLCIFCDNIQVGSMNSSDVINPNPKDNSHISVKKSLGRNLINNMNFNGQVDLDFHTERLRRKDNLNRSNKNFDVDNLSECTTLNKKFLWGTKNEDFKNKLKVLFFNHNDNFSLCCCFNFFNGNMGNPHLRRLRKIGKKRRNISSECSEKSKNVDSSKKDKSKDVNNYEPRPDNNINIITLNKNINFQSENNNGKNFTNDSPDYSNPQKILNDTSNPFKEK